ncbi:RNA polymerase sigma factor, sigma-70 family [Singulisphaera sp. GP187]|uniref:sigma-70 family RNA polymerase sigma factor n=1 Tax=Singulisphaera sp. GP187 TaxID=1882752 RepID=UPI0009269C65|nr:sigma-70 family RNA polymerase sigma factor [Singulisphaera sp. GP187]SIO28820.1 RNA polymerase sigma factor, sigma-70 family [Singulisphaera sp. GP187]
MAQESARKAQQQLGTLFTSGAIGGLSDDELLRRFLRQSGCDAEAAFQVLVERHGPMVMGVCRRMLSDYHAAEDAFQATFLVLARRADAASRQERLANWLYGVAVRAAKELRRSEARRQARERASVDPHRAELATDQGPGQVDLHSVLDEELSRLPGRYRAALVACELEGLSRREAAVQLGVPEGTLSSHLMRGRKLLRERLGRRGFGATAWSLGGLAHEGGWSSVPVSGMLTRSSVRTALGVLSGDVGSVPTSVDLLINSMWRTKLVSKLVMAVGTGVSLGVLALVGVVLAQTDQGSEPHTPPPRVTANPPKPPRVSSSIEGDNLRMNVEVPLDLVVPDTLILRGQGREVEISVGPRLLRSMEGHTGSVFSVAFSPDGTKILSGSGWPWGDRTLRLWDVASGVEIRRFLTATDDPGAETHGPREVPGEVHSLAFTPDGRQALSGGTGGIVQLWDLETGKEIRRLSGHTGTIYELAISPDGRRALTASRDKTARLWDLASGREIHVLKGHTNWVRSVAFSPDGRRALTGSGPKDHTMRLWDLETGGQLKSLEQAGIVRGLAFTPDGVHAIAGINPELPDVPGAIHLWDLDRGVEVRRFDGHGFAVTSIAMAPDGRQFLSTSYDRTIRLWDIASGRELYRLTGHQEWVWTVAYSPRGDLAVSGGGASGGAQTVAPGHDFALRLWDLTGKAEIKTAVPSLPGRP